ncbi:MAG: hypothetical protein ACJ779_10170 [Chloroflexota bacterium]
MTRTFAPIAERDTSLWPLLAAAILGLQGLSTLMYATFLPPPISAAGVDVPVLGTMPFIWLAAATLYLVAGAGLAARLTWSRYLGSVAAVLMMVFGIYNTQTSGLPLVSLVLPAIVLFVIWRRWPTIRAL